MPLDLALIGMPGCPLWNTIELQDLVVGSGTQAVHTLALPDDPTLLGLQLFQQALVFDAGAGNSFGAVTSDGTKLVIGR